MVSALQIDRSQPGALPITVILNSGSGNQAAADAESEIRAGFAESGREYRVLVGDGPEAVRQHAISAVQKARAQPQIIVAAGGDGTINLVAGIVLEHDVPFGIIPLGTFNYVARDLGIPLEPRAAALALATGMLRRIGVGRVNGNLFLNNASFGLYRQLLEEREQFKERFGRYKIVAVIAAFATLWHFRAVYTLRMELDGAPMTLRTPMLFFGLNSLQLENLGVEAARCTQAGMMAVMALKTTSRWQLLKLALRGALHSLRSSPDLRTFCAIEAEVLLPGSRRTRVAVDGESVECRWPLRVEVTKDALQIVVPREPEERK